ncbi:esterase/lipase family protein [Actinomadura sediminis]|uniref:Esterase/lipase family protein n=1 Tax=Actinomadura sediminis TaxID=1038904 RepID=A0ABW3EHI7_9ACTN
MGENSAGGPRDVVERMQVRHLLVVLPGICGSSLHRGRETLWGMSADMRRPIREPRLLAAGYDALSDPGYEDGVVPGGLMSVPVPYLARVLGPYGTLRHGLRKRFWLNELNYMEFPYDWRRPVAVNSARLAAAIRTRLAALAEHVDDPRVIIIAHSMGGLVAAHYLRHHDDAGDCHRVLTAGTPFRGAVKALDFLVNGPELGPVHVSRLAEALREVPGVYDLLPLYRTVADRRPGRDGTARRLVDLVDGIDLDAARVRASRDLLAGLNTPHERSRIIAPLVGHGQRTVQQAILHPGGRLECSKGSDLLPADYHARDGDGTVPVMAATPGGEEWVLPSWGGDSHNGLVHGREHAAGLVNSVATVLSRLRNGDPALAPGDVRRGPAGDQGPPEGGRTVRLDVDDLYPANVPIQVSGRADGCAPGTRLWARLAGEPGAVPARVADDRTFRFEFPATGAGVRILELFAAEPPESPLVTDVIEVA